MLRNRLYNINSQEDLEIYCAFKSYEDDGDKIIHHITRAEALQRKTVLDIGCGCAKYAKNVSSTCEIYIGIDICAQALFIGKNDNTSKNNINFIAGNAEKLPLKDACVDVILCSWFLSSLITGHLKPVALSELFRVLRHGGDIWAIENHCASDFMKLRGTYNTSDPNWTHPLCMYGFHMHCIVETNFAFPDIVEAERVCGPLFGSGSIEYLRSQGYPKVQHKVVILHQEKPLIEQ